MLSATDSFYSSPDALIRPDRARTMGEGWETRRRRDGIHDAVVFKLGVPGYPQLIEIDTSHFVFNASSHAEVWFSCQAGDPAPSELSWEPLLHRVVLQPDTRHRFRVDGRAATHIRLDAYPDGGMARVRVLGPVTPEGRLELGLRWFNALPAEQLAALLADLPIEVVSRLVAARPLPGVEVDETVATGADADAVRSTLLALLQGG